MEKLKFIINYVINKIGKNLFEHRMIIILYSLNYMIQTDSFIITFRVAIKDLIYNKF